VSLWSWSVQRARGRPGRRLQSLSTERPDAVAKRKNAKYTNLRIQPSYNVGYRRPGRTVILPPEKS